MSHDREFTERAGMGETNPESHPEHQLPRRRLVYPSSGRGPSGGSPGRPQGVPYGRLFQKRVYPYEGGPPARPTGVITPPPPAEGRATGFPGFDEKHPVPVQLPRDCWDYFFNLLRQMHVHTENPTWIQPPVRARPLDFWTQLSGQAVPITGEDTSIIQGPHTVPKGYIGVISAVGMSLQSAAAWTFVTFRILKNGIRTERYGSITMQIGLPTDPTRLAAPIIIPDGGTVDLVASNGDAGNAYQAYGRLYGWFFPSQILTTDGSFRQMIVD